VFRDDERTRVLEGAGGLDRLGALARELGASRALLISDPGVAAAGHAARAEALLGAEGLAVEAYLDAAENPSSDDVALAADAARAFRPDLYVAVGGGSAIDTAKGANFVEVCGGRMQDYRGHDTATSPLRPLIAVPTTAGTGSEVQSFALVGDGEGGGKMACGDPSAAPRVALLDPELTVTMPRRVTAMTGLDTLAHAVESAVARPRDPGTDGRSRGYAAAAFALVSRSLPRVLDEPEDLEARADMMRASALAGLAIEHAMLGVAHSMANPLTRHHAVPHGHAVGLMLPHVVRFNAASERALPVYAELARGAGLTGGDDAALAAALADRCAELLALTGLAEGLGALGVGAADVPALAAEANEQWTARFNPREPDVAAFEALLAGAR
jgi:alcohol dehydrogenase